MTTHRRHRWPRMALWTWLVISHLLALALPVGALLGTGAFAMDLQRQTRRSLENQAVLLELLVRSELGHARQDQPADAPSDDAATATVTVTVTDIARRVQPALAEFADTTFAGVRLVGTDGIVVASTGPMMGVDLSQRPEVREALQGRPGWIARSSPPAAPNRGPPPGQPDEGDRIYVATPVHMSAAADAEVVGALLLSRSPRSTLEVLRNMGPRLDLGVSVALAVTLGLATVMGWGFSRTIRRLSRASHGLADGRVAGTDGPWSTKDPDLTIARGSRISEVSALADDFARMADRLQARLHYIAEFAGNVSHEFKTPISTLRGTLELLEDDPHMPADQRARFLDNALAELHRTQRLVDGLLALARADEGRRREQVDLVDLVKGLADDHIELSLCDEPCQVLGDPRQLDVAISNLVDNALAYGGPQAQVQLVLSQRPGGYQLEVIDDGPGISAANLPRVFDRFFTTTRHGGGTGLGLALVKAVVEAHGGDVTVQSRPGHTRFLVTLPDISHAT